MNRSKLFVSLVIAVALITSCRQTWQPGSTNGQPVSNVAPSTPSTESGQTATQEMSATETVIAAKKILESGQSDDQLYSVRAALSRIQAGALEYKEAHRLIPKLDARILQIQQEREAPQRARSAAEAQALREWLQEDYRKTVAEANPYLNFIKASITKTKEGHAIWAIHAYFNRYSFKVGDEAKVVKHWIDKHREQLNKAEIHRVGLMDEDTSGGACWYDF